MIYQPPWQATAQEAETSPAETTGAPAQSSAAQASGDSDRQSSEQVAQASGPRNVSDAPYASGEPRPNAAAEQVQAEELAPAAQTLTIPSGAAATAPGAGVAVENGAFVVHVDHAKVVRLPERTQTVIVGNPIIADVTVQRNGILVVTGKSFGSTNMIALDGAGALLAESMISVQAPQDSVVTVQRGLNRESYSCTPTCQPSLQLGDNPGFFDGVGAQATQRNELATRR
ncbi:MAG: pilus assembly protein N-terminal domain-containing protein [Salinarimonas sp.]|nr:pilus assembly protein N-terminal domain-containing protein [Salinarimonas sp.]